MLTQPRRVLATLNILHIVLTALSVSSVRDVLPHLLIRSPQFKLPAGSESYMINFIDP